MKNQKNWKKKLQYWFDLWLSKGTFSMVILLFAITGLIVLLLSVLVIAIGGAQDISLGSAIWNTLNHAFDPGVLSGDDGNHRFLFVMLLATLCGVFFMAMLIGLINDGISSHMQELSKGIEPVIENDHVVILGFNESTFIIIGELIEAYANQKGKRNAVVVMDTCDKQEMEERIRTQYPDTGNISIVCRSGSAYNRVDLDRCSITTSKSIIVAIENDFDTIKTILACTQMLNACEGAKAFVTSVINKKENEFAARIAGNDTELEGSGFSVANDRLELLMMESTISKIMTHTCRQNGFSKVFTEIFNFSGHEFYIVRNEAENAELFRRMSGRSIREINRYLHSQTAIGIIDSEDRIIIDDPNETILKPDSRLIVLEEDDDRIAIGEKAKIAFNPPTVHYEDRPVSVLIMECNSKLPLILEELCHYLSPGSMIYLAANADDLNSTVDDSLIDSMLGHEIDSAVRIRKSFSASEEIPDHYDIYDYRNMEKLLDECRPDYVLTMSNETLDDDDADEKSLTLLLYCRHYKMLHPEANFGVTCEMRSVINQNLAQNTMTSDFVISRNIASLMMAQIAENRELKGVFEALLSSEGYEIYMKPAKYYLDVAGGIMTDLYSVADAVAAKNEIFIGYKLSSEAGNDPVLNPAKVKNGKIVSVNLCEDDQFIVLAESPEVR